MHWQWALDPLINIAALSESMLISFWHVAWIFRRDFVPSDEWTLKITHTRALPFPAYYIGALTCMRNTLRAKGRGSPRRGGRWRSRNECVRDQERSRSRACVRERGEKDKKITKSPFVIRAFLVTSRKTWSVATHRASTAGRVLSDPRLGFHRSLPVPHQGGETRGFLYL